MGYDVRERPFEFSGFVGRYATPLFGGVGAFVVGIAGSMAASGMRFGPLIVLLASAIALYPAAGWLTRRGVLAVPLLRERGVNLEATRGGVEPAVWLCAHIDSKSQPVPTLVRTVGIMLEAIGFVLAAALAIIAAAGATLPLLLWGLAAAVTLAGALPVVMCVVGSRSPGALDNASGVAAVMSAAREMLSHPAVGVLITDAEELALAGSRAWARGRPVTMVLNCDGVDDAGAIQVMFSGRRPDGVLASAARASRATAVEYFPRRLAFGILTDSVAFADAGMAAVTFSRGTLRSFARVHSRRDDLAHLRGTGIPATAKLMAATAQDLTTGGRNQ
jgi:hypothetical protein